MTLSRASPRLLVALLLVACSEPVANRQASTAAEPEPAPWTEAKPLIRPLLMSIPYREARVPLALEPLADGLLRGYVVDWPISYEYVRVADLDAWGVSLDELGRVALANLDAASQEMSLASTDGRSEILVLDTKDSYDAAHILLPAVRELAAERLGSPFLFAVPHRDYLMMWSSSASPAIHEQARQEVAYQFASDPFSVSDSVFQATATAISDWHLGSRLVTKEN